MTTPQEPRDDDEPTMLPEAYLEQQPDGSTRPMAQDPTSQEPSVQDPYAQPQYGQPQYGQAYGGQAYGGQPVYGQDPSGQAGSTPAYGYGYAAPPANHPSAQTAMVLGIVGLVGFFFCGITLVLSPFAWRMGARARREIDASNGTLGGRDTATVGFVTGIIGSVILVLVVLAIIAIIALFAFGASTYDTSG